MGIRGENPRKCGKKISETSTSITQSYTSIQSKNEIKEIKGILRTVYCTLEYRADVMRVRSIHHIV